MGASPSSTRKTVLEAPHAAILLGRQAHRVAEDLNEARLAEADALRHRRHRRRMGSALQRGQRIANGRVGQALRPQARQQRLFQQGKAARRRGRGQQVVAQALGRRAPDRLQRDHLIMQFSGGQPQKGQRAAWLELDAQHVRRAGAVEDGKG